MSQRDLEARSGVDQTTISWLERGLRPGMRLDGLAAVLRGLEVAMPSRPPPLVDHDEMPSRMTNDRRGSWPDP